MNGPINTCLSRSLLLLFGAILLIPASGWSQGYQLHRCMANSEIPGRVLNAPFSINLFADTAVQNIRTCGNFCASGAVPSAAQVSGTRTGFNPPYPFSLYNAGWCFCGNSVTGTEVAADQCAGQQNCLLNPTARCQTPQWEGYMVFTTGSGNIVDPTNRPPNAPTVSPGAYEPPVAVPYGGGVQLAWRDNGDPDGDALTFGVFVMQFDPNTATWVPVSAFRDQYGNPAAQWISATSFTFSAQTGLQPGTSYSWGVIACEVGRGASDPCGWSGWSVFRTQ